MAREQTNRDSLNDYSAEIEEMHMAESEYDHDDEQRHTDDS